MGLLNLLRHGSWNAFTNQGTAAEMTSPLSFGVAHGSRPDRPRMNLSNERSIISSIYTRLGIDVASLDVRHVQLDDQGQYESDRKSSLNYCLTVEANIDQAASAFWQDIAMSLFDKGAIAVCPIVTSLDPAVSGSYEIETMRVGEIVQWHPQHVRVSLYNDETGRKEEVTLPKKLVAVVENPLYPVMNEPNSTLQRLIRKLNLLDAVDEASSSGKLDLIIQLPYVIKTEEKKKQAEQRKQDLEFQLKGSTYGIAYTDGTEKITQLNRPTENNLLGQITFLTEMLYAQLGLTKEVMEGTADESAMLNYYNRTVEPIVRAIVESMRRSFLTKTARSQGQQILYFRDPFKLVPVGQIAEIADKFTRNEILTGNEIRSIIGVRPSKDPKADELRNSNMPAPSESPATPSTP